MLINSYQAGKGMDLELMTLEDQVAPERTLGGTSPVAVSG